MIYHPYILELGAKIAASQLAAAGWPEGGSRALGANCTMMHLIWSDLHGNWDSLPFAVLPLCARVPTLLDAICILIESKHLATNIIRSSKQTRSTYAIAHRP